MMAICYGLCHSSLEISIIACQYMPALCTPQQAEGRLDAACRAMAASGLPHLTGDPSPFYSILTNATHSLQAWCSGFSNSLRSPEPGLTSLATAAVRLRSAGCRAKAGRSLSRDSSGSDFLEVPPSPSASSPMPKMNLHLGVLHYSPFRCAPSKPSKHGTLLSGGAPAGSRYACHFIWLWVRPQKEFGHCRVCKGSTSSCKALLCAHGLTAACTCTFVMQLGLRAGRPSHC